MTTFYGWRVVGAAFVVLFTAYGAQYSFGVFFNALRLCDRLNLQLRLRGVSQRAPRGLVLGACICTVIPYVNLLIGIPIIWTITVCLLQSSVNQVAALRRDQWDASVYEAA